MSQPDREKQVMQSRRTAAMGWAQSLAVILAGMVCISGWVLTHQLRLEGRLHDIATQEAHIGILLNHMHRDVQTLYRIWPPHHRGRESMQEHLINALDHSNTLLQSLKQATAGMNLEAPLHDLAQAMDDTKASALALPLNESLAPWRQALDNVDKAYRQAIASARQASEQGYALAHRVLMFTLLLEFALVAFVVWLGSPPVESHHTPSRR